VCDSRTSSSAGRRSSHHHFGPGYHTNHHATGDDRSANVFLNLQLHFPDRGGKALQDIFRPLNCKLT
jgi:hypothetical protein